MNRFSEQTELRPGTLIDHFRIKRLLGKGGMGEVYLARDTRLGRRVALKILHPEDLGDPAAVKRCVSEARTTAKFNHPHIVTIYAVGKFQDRPYLALEYLEGDSLRERMDRENLSVREVLHIGLAIAEALAEAHENNVLHRDLKPENVVLPRDGRLRVVDFGLAKTIRPTPEMPKSAYTETQQGFPSPPNTPTKQGISASPDTPKKQGISASPDTNAQSGFNLEKQKHANENLSQTPDLGKHGQGAGSGDGGHGADSTASAGRYENGRPLTTTGPSPEYKETEPKETLQSFIEEYLSTGKGFVGTPAYMSPEQWKEQKATAASDMWAFGIVLYELLCGRRPYRDPANPLVLAVQVCETGPVPSLTHHVDVAEPLAELVDRCLAKDPDSRPHATEAVQYLKNLIQQQRPRINEGKSPFRGLLPFDEMHADFFFGREEEISLMVERLRREPLLPVVGPSGAGKSSLVQAGLIPRLRDQTRWLVLSLRPGAQPFLLLASRIVAGQGTDPNLSFPHPRTSKQLSLSNGLLDSGENQDQAPDPQDRTHTLAAQLRQKPQTLNLQLQKLAESQNTRVLLFIDQMEEIHGLVGDAQVRRQFMEAVCSAADDPQDPVRVVFTLRDDFLGRLAMGSKARETLSRVVVVRNPGPQALREILTRPLEVMGYTYEDDALVDEMIAEVRAEPVCLPLLQFTCHSLWNRRDREKRVITRRAYKHIGGVAGALVRHADGVLDGMTSRQVSCARHIMLRLVSPAATRKVLSPRALLDGLGKEARVVLERLIKERLVAVRRTHDGKKEKTRVELVHESLIHNWRRLAHWLEESREDLAFLDEIGQAAALWEKRGRRNEEAWTGKALHEAEGALGRCTTEVSSEITAFLEAGRRAEKHRKKRRRLWAFSGLFLLSAFALLAVVVALIVIEKNRQVRRQRDRARMESLRAEKRHAASEREGARAALVRGDLLEARARLRSSVERTDSPMSRALWWRMSTNPLIWKKELNAGIYDVAFSPDGKRVAAVGHKSTIHVFDTQTCAAQVLHTRRAAILSVAFGSRSQRLAAGTQDGYLEVFDLGPLKTHRSIQAHPSSAVWGVAVHPNGRLIATGGADHLIKLWDVANGTLKTTLRGHKSAVSRLMFSHDGKKLASSSMDNTIRIWDVAGRTCRRVLAYKHTPLSDVALSTDGRLVAGAARDGKLPVWDLETGKLIRVFTGHTARVNAVAFGPEGKTLASGAVDHSVRLWNISTGREIRHFSGHRDSVWAVAFGPHGKRLVTSGSDHTVRLWNIRTGPRSHNQRSHRAEVVSACFHPNGQLLATASYDRSIIIWDVQSGTIKTKLHGHRAKIVDLKISRNGKILVSGSQDGTVKVWDMQAGKLLHTLLGKKKGTNVVAPHPDGEFVVDAGNDNRIVFLDVSSGRKLNTIVTRHRAIRALAFDPSGRKLALSTYHGDLEIWDTTNPHLIFDLAGHSKLARGLCFPDSDHLLSASWDKALRYWNLKTGRMVYSRPLPAPANGLACRSGGDRAVALRDGTIRILDRFGKTKQTFVAHRGDANWVTYSPNGKLLASTGDDCNVRLWHRNGRPYWWAAALLVRPPRLCSHAGWINLDESRQTRLPASKWERYISTHAARVAESKDGGLTCVLTHGGKIQSFAGSPPQKLFEHPVGISYTAQLCANADGCLLLSPTRKAEQRRATARFFGRNGKAAVLSERATAVHADHKGVLMATPQKVIAFDRKLKTQHSVPISGQVTAVTRAGDRLIVGFADGTLEVLRPAQTATPDSAATGPTVVFEQLPISPVVALATGPLDTVIAGFANGELGFWHLRNGRRLRRVFLHGPLTYLRLWRKKLYAATDLGDFRTFDLDVFYWNYNTFVDAIRRRVPVIWSNGRVTRTR